MDKNLVLSHLVLETRAAPTLLGGEPLAGVMRTNKYVPQQRDPEADSLDRVLHATLCSGVKAVLLMGPEGSGKTITLEKLMMDWAGGEVLQNFSYVFFFGLREMKALREPVSLETLVLQHRVRSDQGAPVRVEALLQEPEKVLFIFDDLDRSELQLEPSAHEANADPNPDPDPGQAVSPSSLVSSLLRGSVLKGSVTLVSARSARGLGSKSFTRVEVPGFLKAQREEFVRRFFPDPATGSAASAQMERTLGFHEFCSSPRSCWTVCALYQTLMSSGAELPETVTQLCVQILVQLLKEVSLDQVQNRDLVLVLGRLASLRRSRFTKEELGSAGFWPFLRWAHLFLPVGVDLESCDFLFASRLVLDFLLALSVFLDQLPPGGFPKVLEEHRGSTEYLHLFLSGLSEPDQYRPLEALLGPLDSPHYELQQLRYIPGTEGSPGTRDQELMSPHSLQENRLSAHAMESLSTALGSGHCRLTSLDLNRSGITDAGVKALCRSLRSQSCQLTSLNLYNNNLTGDCCADLMRTLVFPNCPLLELDLSVNDLGQEGALLICRALSASGCGLKKLRLARCLLTSTVFQELGSLLRGGSPPLSCLVVGVNKVGDEAVKHVLDAVADPRCHLEDLDLEMTKMTDASLQHVCTAIRTSKTLKNLELRNNLMTDWSVPALVQAVQDSTTMEELCLRYNDFSEDVFPLLDSCDRINY